MLLFLFSNGASGQPAAETTDKNECEMEPLKNYNFSFHVAGVFIVLAVSAVGMFSTIWLGKRSKEPLMAKVLQLLKMFGIGVIIGTAWIHLLPDAISQFTSPCLDSSWAAYGTSFIGLFACIAAFGIQVLEQVAISKTSAKNDSKSHDDFGKDIKVFDLGATVNHNDSDHSHELEVFLLNQTMTTIILELGIMVHSLIIGLTLGVTGDDGYTSLLIAVSFHQFFEGMALGTLITSTTLNWRTKFSLGCVYPLTTPLGIAIGITVKDFFNVNSSHLIVVQGILSSLSLGILMYNCYAELIGGEVNRNPQFLAYSSSFKCFCYLIMFAGAGAMAVIGIWA